MNTNEIVAALDEEIGRLQQARKALAGIDGAKTTGRELGKRRPGQPQGSANMPVEIALARRRTMNAEGARERSARPQGPS